MEDLNYCLPRVNIWTKYLIWFWKNAFRTHFYVYWYQFFAAKFLHVMIRKQIHTTIFALLLFWILWPKTHWGQGTHMRQEFQTGETATQPRHHYGNLTAAGRMTIIEFNFHCPVNEVAYSLIINAPHVMAYRGYTHFSWTQFRMHAYIGGLMTTG